MECQWETSEICQQQKSRLSIAFPEASKAIIHHVSRGLSEGHNVRIKRQGPAAPGHVDPSKSKCVQMQEESWPCIACLQRRIVRRFAKVSVLLCTKLLEVLQ